tara:strand:+ start:2397 stop:2696 length:300 start_codon:yes stop_codon:yes gene_type:complete
MREYSRETLEASEAIYAMQHHKMKDRTREVKSSAERRAIKARRDALDARLEMEAIENGELYIFGHNLTKTDTRHQSELQRKRAKENGSKGNFGKFYGSN